MKKILITTSILALGLAVGCKKETPSASSPNVPVPYPHVKKIKAHGEFLVPTGNQGIYAFDDNGVWWFYYFNLDSSVTMTSNGSRVYSIPPSLPPGGNWVKAEAPPKGSVLQEEEEEITENEESQPETVSESEPSVSEPSVSEPSTSPSESAPSESSPSDSGSSGGDSGGGDGGGGDGGGGD
jgi:uncharacterized membrane protein YgcG